MGSRSSVRSGGVGVNLCRLVLLATAMVMLLATGRIVGGTVSRVVCGSPVVLWEMCPSASNTFETLDSLLHPLGSAATFARSAGRLVNGKRGHRSS